MNEIQQLQTVFNGAYFLSQPPEIQALIRMNSPAYAMPPGAPGTNADQSTIGSTAATLAQKGFAVDVPIMVWGWDPYLTMSLRQSAGYTWVPTALQAPMMVAPNLPGFGTLPAYDPNNPPAGSIKVSLNLADYPPFDPPAPAVPVPVVTDPVGLQSVGNLYLSVVGDAYPDGAQYSDARGTFLKHVTITPFGRTTYWEKIR